MTNQEFVELWRDIWFVHTWDGGGGGIGHYLSRLVDNGSVLVTCQMDFTDSDSITDGYPEKAETHMHSERELTLADVNRFYWPRYYTAEDATPAAKRKAKANGMRRYNDSHTITPIGWEALMIKDGTGYEEEVDAPGKGPIVPDFLMPLYAATRPFDKSLEWPVRFLAFDRSTEKRKWAVWSSQIRYAGRKGPTTGLSHTFESGNVGDGRIFSVWVDDNGKFIGFGDEREVSLVAENEEMARAFLMAGRPVA